MSDTPTDPTEVRHVAGLARIDLDDEDVDRFAEQFAEILSHFDSLDEVPAVEADPELTNVMREDEVRESLPRDAALSNAPRTEDGKFRGPNVS